MRCNLVINQLVYLIIDGLTGIPKRLALSGDLVFYAFHSFLASSEQLI